MIPTPMEQRMSAARVLLSIPEAQVRASVCRRTIYNWLNAGKLEYIRTAGGSVRIYEDSLFRTANNEAIASV